MWDETRSGFVASWRKFFASFEFARAEHWIRDKEVCDHLRRIIGLAIP